MELAELPTILEIKRTLDGLRKEFRCQLLERGSDRAVVLFVSSQRYEVGGLVLPPGTVTLGHFWEARAYNVYHWLAPSGATLAHYFNLAADTEIGEVTIGWLDLALDVLVPAGAPARVLDEDELPPGLDAATRARIEAARREVLEQHAPVIADLESQATALWPRLFGVGRP
jgi:predicted RNA-binding protein associated with RNAse of E/G family